MWLLTPLQREILTLVVNGLSNAEIAEHLQLTPGMVGTQIGRICGHLSVRSRAELRSTIGRLRAEEATLVH